jgi:3,5-dihydroxyphenylacetyl-CoA synthase
MKNKITPSGIKTKHDKPSKTSIIDKIASKIGIYLMETGEKLVKKEKLVLRAEDIAFNRLRTNETNLVINGIYNYLPEFEFDTKKFITSISHKLSDKLIDQLINMDIKKKKVACDVQKLLEKKDFKLTETNSSLSIKAINNLLNNSDIDIDEIDYLITATETEDYISPGLSNVLIDKLDFRKSIRHTNVTGMGCSSIITLLDLAEDYLLRYPEKNILLVLSVLSTSFYKNIFDIDKFYTIEEINNDPKLYSNRKQHISNWLNMIQIILFADAASAIMISNKKRKGTKNYKLVKSYHLTNLYKNDSKLAYFQFIDGQKNLFLDKKLPIKGVKYAKLLFNQIPEEMNNKIKKWIIHTGSKKIIDGVISVCNLPKEICQESYNVLENCGNLSLCSTLLGLSNLNTETEKGSYIGILSFGNGFKAGICILEKL